MSQLRIFKDLISKASVEEEYRDDQETLSDSFFHLEKVLNNLRKTKDATERGTVITTIQEILENLALNAYKNDPYTKELIDFLDNYCDKQGIQKSMYSDDLSDLSEGERVRIFKALSETE